MSKPLKKRAVIVSRPKPFEKIGAEFTLSGLVPLSWLDYGSGFLDGVSFELLNTEGRTGMGTSITVSRIGWFAKLIGYVPFGVKFRFNHFNYYFIKEAQGRIVIRLSGTNEKEQSVFIPLIVPELEPAGGPDPEVVNRHGKVGEMISQYEIDLQEHNSELEKIRERRKQKDNIFEDKSSNEYSYASIMTVGPLLGILGEAEEDFKEYIYREEDEQERELNEKYKDALAWRGPLFHGTAARLDNFEFRVYSNDHGKHFHVIHREKGINARFSFPEIELLNYKNTRNTISSKEQLRIKEFFKVSENLEKLKAEFERRAV